MKPKIAWVVYDFPYPANSGGKLRAYHLIKRLSQDFEIDLYSFYRQPPLPEDLNQLKDYCSVIKIYPRHSPWSVGNLLKALFSTRPLLNVSYLNGQLKKDLLVAVKNRSYRLVHFEFLGVANLLPEVQRLGVKTVFGTENSEYQIYWHYALSHWFSPFWPLFLYDVWKMKLLETRLLQIADLCLAVSAVDAAGVEQLAHRSAVLVQNGIEIKERQISVKDNWNPPKAYFAGDLNYQQNRHALNFFLKMILPEILKSEPDFRLIVLSKTVPHFVKRYAANIDLVTDAGRLSFEEASAEARLFISPVQIKSGTNIKILQAAAAGLPIVGTTASFVGYDFENEQDVLVRDEPEQFAEAVIRLLREPQKAFELSRNAFARVQKYSWDNSAKILKDAYLKLLS